MRPMVDGAESTLKAWRVISVGFPDSLLLHADRRSGGTVVTRFVRNHVKGRYWQSVFVRSLGACRQMLG